jgi:hypothetical protein
MRSSSRAENKENKVTVQGKQAVVALCIHLRMESRTGKYNKLYVNDLDLGDEQTRLGPDHVRHLHITPPQ